MSKVAFITGSSRNMGRSFARELAKNGTRIVIHHRSDNSRAAAEETASKLGVDSIIVKGDLSKPEVTRQIFKQIIDKFGRLDIVINNAGEAMKKPIIEITEQDYDRIFGINAKAAFFVIQEAAKCISDNGRIINMSTSLLASTTPFYAGYTGSKAPIEHFTKAAAQELGGRGITVNAIAPGPIDTPLLQKQETPESLSFLTNMVPAKRLGKVDDVVPVVKFLVSDEAKWISGQTIFINGALTSR